MTATLYDANPKSRSPGLKRADPAFATAIQIRRKPQIPIAGTETTEKRNRQMRDAVDANPKSRSPGLKPLIWDYARFLSPRTQTPNPDRRD